MKASGERRLSDVRVQSRVFDSWRRCPKLTPHAHKAERGIHHTDGDCAAADQLMKMS